MKEILCFIVRDDMTDNIEVVYKDERPVEDVIRSMDPSTKAASAVGTSTVFRMLVNTGLPKGDFYEATNDMILALAGKPEEDFKSDLKNYISDVVKNLVSGNTARIGMLLQLGLTAENILMRNIINDQDFGLSETKIPVKDLSEVSEGSIMGKILKQLGLDGEMEFQPILIDGVEIGIGGKFVEKHEETAENTDIEDEDDAQELS